MARRPRVFASGLLYQVIVCGNQRQKCFLVYLGRLEKYRAKFHIRIYSYCLMRNHVHLLLETGSIPLAKFMQGLQQSYTQYFNRSYRKVGHLFQGRYQAIICNKDEYLLALVRYIHLNPVRARLAKRPERYPHSGHGRYLVNGTPKIIEVCPILKLLGGNKEYENFVLEGMSESHNDEYYTVEDQRFLGEEGFGKEIGNKLRGRSYRRTDPEKVDRNGFQRDRPQLDATPDVLRSKDRRWGISKKRAEAVAALVRQHGYGVSEVAKFVRRDQANISTMLSRLSAKEQR
jgi:putative transposase